MNVSRRWLEAFLRRPLDAPEVAEHLAMLGAPVDAIEPLGAELAGFVVGEVTALKPHPNADKLRVATVDDGTGTLHNVVCGAPNVMAGGKYPFARLGTVMPGGMVVERRKLRGEPSEGMLCSSRELALGDDHDGLLTLSPEVAPGTSLLKVLQLGDDRLLVDVTPNRGDLLSHKGIARELAVAYGIPYRLPALEGEAEVDLPTPNRFGDEAMVGGVKLTITDRPGCRRFLAAVVSGVRVGTSPAWLRDRLSSVGVRSINNVVDATNYVMLELGQPMHAYDAATLHGPSVMARSAVAGETLVTLDGVDRKLPTGALVIADADRVIGIAGVMGGRDTEVTEGTTTLFLECASFEPARVRAARTAIGLSTDASHRFERGVDRWGAVDAFRRCLRLIVSLSGGSVEGEAVDCFPAPDHPPRIFLRPSRVAQVLGISLPWTELEKQLVAMGATVVSKPDDGRIVVDVPGWRSDVTSEIDLIEEIARLHGYARIPDDLHQFRPGLQVDAEAWAVAARVRLGLAAMGLSEVQTMPLVGETAAHGPRLVNPLSAELAYLRSSVRPALIGVVEANWAMHIADIRLFEVGTVFTTSQPGVEPIERLQAAFVISGARAPLHWTDGGKPQRYDRWDAKALFDRLVDLAHPGATVQVEDDRWVAKAPDGMRIGECGPLTGDAPAWAAPVFGGEVTVATVTAMRPAYRPLPTYPEVLRDLALLVPLGRSVDAVTALLQQRGGRHHLESVAVLDEFRAATLPAGMRSVMIRLVFRAPDRTLTDNEVEPAVRRLLTSLERELDVILRTT